MRRSAFVALAAAAALAPAVAAAQTVTAPLGRAVRVPLAGSAADVIVGNPKIADVTVVSPTALFVSGRGYGSTNLIVMDRTGRTVFNGQVMVPVADEGQVTVHRGKAAALYFCAPNCDQAVEADAKAADFVEANALSTSETSASRAAPAAPPPMAAALNQ